MVGDDPQRDAVGGESVEDQLRCECGFIIGDDRLDGSGRDEGGDGVVDGLLRLVHDGDGVTVSGVDVEEDEVVWWVVGWSLSGLLEKIHLI